MTKTRHFHHRKDDNHNEVVRACEVAGLLVEDIHDGGLADILAARGTNIFIIEIKGTGKRNDLTEKQKEKRKKWGHLINTVESAEEIFKIAGMK